jgi:hypothetical protein
MFSSLENIDIDTQEDLNRGRKLLKNLKKNINQNKDILDSDCIH